MTRELIRDGVYKTSWDAEGFDYEEPLLTLTTVRLGEQDDKSAPAIANCWIGPNKDIRKHSHPGWTVLIVLDGDFTTDDGEIYRLGDIRVMRPNTQYAMTAGRFGVRILEILEIME